MDKNTIIGLLLIGAIIIGFSIYNRPSQEQLAEQRRVRDSVRLVEKQRADTTVAEKNITKDNSALPENQHGVFDFFSGTNPAAAAADSSLTAVDSAGIQNMGYAQAPASQFATLENDKVLIRINTRGGGISSVKLKEYMRYNNDSLYLFDGDQEAGFNMDLYNRNSVKLSTANHVFTPIPSADGRSITMRLQNAPGQYLEFVYSLPPEAYMMKFDINLIGMSNGLHPESLNNFKIDWQQKLRRQEKGEKFERRYARIIYRYADQGTVKMNPGKNDTKEITEPVQWFAFKDQFFTTVVIPDKPFANAILASKDITTDNYLKDYKAETWVPVTAEVEKNTYHVGFRYYFGPVHYNTLKAYDKNIEKSSDKLYLQDQVELGYKWLSWINKFFVIPVFNFFLSLNWSMGLIILVLTLMIKMIISPLTFKSYMSSAKMRVLRPQVKEIEAKHPGNDQENMLKRQKETMDLYSRAGASPMSGCMPMLLQTPVLFALFFFFPSAIELRHQSFLWADDLSTFDSIISWNGYVPFITNFMGNHISLVCVLMTITTVIYTKYSMQSTDTGQGQMAAMKYMPYFMSIFMFFFLNSYPAGLNYYYFVSTLFTIVITLAFRQFVNEDKLLTQLEANKKKPKKKSGFMARLEEAQKMQEKQARERAKANAKKNYKR